MRLLLYVGGMFRGVVAVLAVAGAMLLSSCASESKSPQPSLTSERTKVFSSKAEALSAFNKVYKAYLTATNEVAGDGGDDPERLQQFVSKAEYLRNRESMRRYSSAKLHLEGRATAAPGRLQSVDLETGRGSAYFCLNVERTRIVDAKKVDVTPSTRIGKQPLLVSFVKGPRIDSSEAWTGDGVC